MGDRGQIIIEDTGIHLYTHWHGSRMRDPLAEALGRRRDLWDDPEHLASHIFEALKNGEDGITGFGISGTETDGRKRITVDCNDRMVVADDTVDAPSEPYSFEEFIANHGGDR